MKERDCANCKHHTEDGCSKWDCEFERAMTSKEAIRVLEDNRPSVIFEDKDAQKRMAELCKAIDMAIEALSADAVSRDEYEELYCKAKEVNGMANDILADFPSYKELVSADTVQGEWEDKEVFNDTDDDHIVEKWQSARCSVCGKYHTTPYMYYFYNFNFCPNCGAKMKGGDSE